MQIKEAYIDIKKQNMSAPVDTAEIYALIKRVTNESYAAKIELEILPDDGFDVYEVCDKDGKVLIRSSTGVGFASGFNAYLKERCGYSIGALTTSGSLPEVPPAVGESIKRKSEFLYRYFFNYCTFSYTYAFDLWEDWEKTIDYLLLSGYNLILNPIGTETVWRNTLIRMGYGEKEADAFLCGPAFYAWQWMMNMTGWAGGVPKWWYDARVELAGRINKRLHAFGASAVIPAFIGMVPDNFANYYPNATIINQGVWCELNRPSLMMPNSDCFKKMAEIYFEESKKIHSAEHMHYYSADPFHEGGITEGVDLYDYATKTFEIMSSLDKNAVWMFQGWTNSPKPEMVSAIPDGRAIVTNLGSGNNYKNENLYAGAPWCYCEVFCFGGQYNYQGNAQSILETPYKCLADENSNMIGMGFMPEAVNCNEILYEIVAHNGFAKSGKLEEFVPYYIKTRYGIDSDSLTKAWLTLCRKVLNGTEAVSGESALCARPALDTRQTSRWSHIPNPYVDQSPLVEYIEAMLGEYDTLGDNAAYRKDLMEAARQSISNLSWFFVEKLRLAYGEKDIDALSYYGGELLSLYDIQCAIVSTDQSMLLGRWLEKAKRLGRTPAEKAYFEWNARTQITLWANREGSAELRDYSAREWQGVLEDFYRPRWERFISRLEIALLTGKPLETVNYYDEEVPFTYEKKAYPTIPFGDLRLAVENALAKIKATKIEYKAEAETQLSFEENVMKDMANN